MKKVLAHGCFDLFHYGHLHHLQEARKLGDVLIVSVTEDEFVNKGPHRPAFPLAQRMAMIRALAIVDNVISSKSAEHAISQVKPHVYVKGIEYRGKLPEEKLVNSYGGKVIFTEGPVFSSTRLLARKDFKIPSLSDWRFNR